jgi:hypothetical protein
LLARDHGGSLARLPDDVKGRGREAVHGGRVRFEDWVARACCAGAAPDVDGLVPFTRWVTPAAQPRRFSTQMYVYMLPLEAGGEGVAAQSTTVASDDGGKEVTAATFGDAAEWLRQAAAGEIILFPPQFYLLHHLARFLDPKAGQGAGELRRQRQEVLDFLRRPQDEAGSGKEGSRRALVGKIPWAEKVISPVTLGILEDERWVLGLDRPGPELKDTSRGGDWERVVLVRFQARGVPREVEVRWRHEMTPLLLDGAKPPKL